MRRRIKRLMRKQRVSPGDAERLVHWYKALPELEDLANEHRKRAVSWKGFHVGIGALVRHGDQFSRIGGANHKKAEGRRQHGDHCAEEEIFAAAEDLQPDEILGMVCVAPHQPDDISQFDLGVTIACGHCRTRFRKLLERKDAPLKPGTRLLFVNAENRDKRVELTVDALLKLCATKDREHGH